jgi:hypothetical protein
MVFIIAAFGARRHAAVWGTSLQLADTFAVTRQ